MLVCRCVCKESGCLNRWDTRRHDCPATLCTPPYVMMLSVVISHFINYSSKFVGVDIPCHQGCHSKGHRLTVTPEFHFRSRDGSQVLPILGLKDKQENLEIASGINFGLFSVSGEIGLIWSHFWVAVRQQHSGPRQAGHGQLTNPTLQGTGGRNFKHG